MRYLWLREFWSAQTLQLIDELAEPLFWLGELASQKKPSRLRLQGAVAELKRAMAGLSDSAIQPSSDEKEPPGGHFRETFAHDLKCEAFLPPGHPLEDLALHLAGRPGFEEGVRVLLELEKFVSPEHSKAAELHVQAVVGDREAAIEGLRALVKCPGESWETRLRAVQCLEYLRVRGAKELERWLREEGAGSEEARWLFWELDHVRMKAARRAREDRAWERAERARKKGRS